jgi:hypothetical protein
MQGIIYILLFIIIILSLAIVYCLRIINTMSKNGVYLTKKEKEFLEFSVNMYIEYAEELEINDNEHHDKIVKNLEAIKNKHLIDG